MDTQFTDRTNQQRWTELLRRAVAEPGMILKAYTAFHGYSIGNQIAALFQCQLRGIEPGPIDTYKGWLDKGRHVRKGEKGISLCMPVTRKRKAKDQDAAEDDEYITRFVWRPFWFVLAQTEGEAVPMPEIPEWDIAPALAALGIQQVQFTLTDGNVQGYAQKLTVAVSPLAELPHKTLFHELAHVVLGHTLESNITDTDQIPRNLMEVEAESVALLLCESLQMSGAEYSRGYIPGWLAGEPIPEKSAQRIFGAADRILKAGHIDSTPCSTESEGRSELA